MYKQSESEPNISLSPEPEELANPPAQWTVDALPRLERESSKDVTLNNLLTALNHVVELLNAAGIEWAVMGGVAMFMHGLLDRNTRDVDVAVDAKPKEVIAALKSQRYVRQFHIHAFCRADQLSVPGSIRLRCFPWLVAAVAGFTCSLVPSTGMFSLHMSWRSTVS